MRFDGTDDVITIGNTGRSVKTTAFWVKPTTTTEDFIDFDGGTHSVEVVAGTVTATGWDTPTIYVNGVAGTALSAGLWSFIVVTTDTAFTASNIVLGNETIYLEGLMGPTRIYSDAKASTWVTTEYDKSKNALWRTNWGIHTSVAARAAGDFLENSPFAVVSGTHQISTATIENTTCKVIECVTSGRFYVPSSQFHQTPTEAAYGEWNFWINKADASNLVVPIIGDGSATGSYQVGFNADESISLTETGVGVLWSTAAAYFTAATWYNFKITRSNAGVFTAYLNDVLIDVTGGSGTNPVTDNTTTTSTYLTFDIDAGDKVAYSDLVGDHSIIKRVMA
jgi:hypothetical protein